MTQKEHIEYIKNKGKLKNLKTYGLFFPDIAFISKWYVWFKGLINNEIKPITRAQRDFINYFKNEIEPNKNNLPSIHSKSYNELSKNQKSLIRYYFVEIHKDKIVRLSKLKGENSIYFYAKVFAEFTKDKVPKRFEGTQWDKEVQKRHFEN